MRCLRILLGAGCLFAAAVHGAPPTAPKATPPPTPPPLPEISADLIKENEKAYTLTRETTYNETIAAVVKSMPKGGGYSSTGKANTALAAAISLDTGGHFALRPEVAKPAYCSGATYLVFLATIDRLERDGRVQLPHDVMEALLMQRQGDGVGIWGRWNANGPGTACLFHDLALGRNFTSIDGAMPGDFAKFWWSEEVGAKEHGHSVVFMGTGKDPKGLPTVTFWSANIPDGFGTKTIPRQQIHRALFSRLEHPQALEATPQLEPKDKYLADMLKRASTDEELAEKAGLPKGETGLNEPPTARPVPVRRAPVTPEATPAASPTPAKKRLF